MTKPSVLEGLMLENFRRLPCDDQRFVLKYIDSRLAMGPHTEAPPQPATQTTTQRMPNGWRVLTHRDPPKGA